MSLSPTAASTSGGFPQLPTPLCEWFKDRGLPPCTALQLSQANFFQVYMLRLCHSLSNGQKPVPPLSTLLPGADRVLYNWDIVIRGLTAIGFNVTREKQDKLKETGSAPSGLFEDLSVELHKWWLSRSGQIVHVNPHQQAMLQLQNHKINYSICSQIVRDVVSSACEVASNLPSNKNAKKSAGVLTAPKSSKMVQRYQATMTCSEVVWGIVECVVSGLTTPGDLESVLKTKGKAIVPSAIEAHHRRIQLEKGVLWKQQQRILDQRNKAFLTSKEEVKDMLQKLKAEKEAKDKQMLEELKQQEARLREMMEKQRKKQQLEKEQQKLLVEEYKKKQEQEAIEEARRQKEDAEKQRIAAEERVKKLQQKKELERQQKEDLQKRISMSVPDVMNNVFGKTTGKEGSFMTGIEEDVLNVLYDVLRNARTLAPNIVDEEVKNYLQTAPRMDGLQIPEISSSLTFTANHMAWQMLLSPKPLTTHDVTSLWKSYGRVEKYLTRTEIIALFPPSPPSSKHIVASIMLDPRWRSYLFEMSPSHGSIALSIETNATATAVVLLSCSKHMPKAMPEMVEKFTSSFPDGPSAIAAAQMDPARIDVTSWKIAYKEGKVDFKSKPTLGHKWNRTPAKKHAEPPTTTTTPVPPDTTPQQQKENDAKKAVDPTPPPPPPPPAEEQKAPVKPADQTPAAPADSKKPADATVKDTPASPKGNGPASPKSKVGTVASPKAGGAAASPKAGERAVASPKSALKK
eukprot:PhF_6_TR39670/c0_g1_i1/m.58904